MIMGIINYLIFCAVYFLYTVYRNDCTRKTDKNKNFDRY